MGMDEVAWQQSVKWKKTAWNWALTSSNIQWLEEENWQRGWIRAAREVEGKHEEWGRGRGEAKGRGGFKMQGAINGGGVEVNAAEYQTRWELEIVCWI